jgi:hypothetical protein
VLADHTRAQYKDVDGLAIGLAQARPELLQPIVGGFDAVPRDGLHVLYEPEVGVVYDAVQRDGFEIQVA